MLLLYSLARILDGHSVRSSILIAHKIRSSPRINTSTENSFDTRRSGIRKVHTYPRKVLAWIPLGSYLDRHDHAREILILYVSTLHVVFHVDRAERHRKDNDNPDNMNYPSPAKQVASLPICIQDVLKTRAPWNNREQYCFKRANVKFLSSKINMRTFWESGKSERNRTDMFNDIQIILQLLKNNGVIF